MYAKSTQLGPWSRRWDQLARALGIARDERLLLALSGGADSVLLLHLLAEADRRPPLVAVHVDHGLRGADSEADARFCRNLTRALDVPFVETKLELGAERSSLEARAREARYGVLEREARARGHHTILTGHHSDDALETLLWRWVRGTPQPGLRGHQVDSERGDLRIVRPLSGFRREEVRRLLRDRGLLWREDESNSDPSFTRSRMRHGFLPFVERVCGTNGMENLRAFGHAVEKLEERLAGATAHFSWQPAPYALATRGSGQSALGGTLPRPALMQLAEPLRRRVLWRLLTEGTGRSPGRRLLRRVLEDLGAGRCARHALARGWVLVLRSRELHLVPPRLDLHRMLAPQAEHSADPQNRLPFPTPRGAPADDEPSAAVTLNVPGILTLADGRRLSAERLRRDAQAPCPLSPNEVELDAEGLPDRLEVRWPRPGDRFHALGAPGSRPLRRFLADRGVPREERTCIPLVVCGGEILWVCGVQPGERHRLRRDTSERLHLSLHHAEA